MQKRIVQREPGSSRNLFFDCGTCLYQVGRSGDGRHERKAKVWERSQRVLCKSANLLLEVRHPRVALIHLEQIWAPHLVLNNIPVLVKTAELKRSSEVCRFENVRPLIPERGAKKKAVSSPDVSSGILHIKRAPLLAIKGLG